MRGRPDPPQDRDWEREICAGNGRAVPSVGAARQYVRLIGQDPNLRLDIPSSCSTPLETSACQRRHSSEITVFDPGI